MANNGPFCTGMENDKGNIFESELWKKTVTVLWCVSKVPQYILSIVVITVNILSKSFIKSTKW